MNSVAVLKLMNRMVLDGIVERYAVGGAVAASAFVEPVSTLDIDIVIAVAPTLSSALVSLTPIYDYLIARGAVVEGEHLVIGGWPVQFIVPTGALMEEALLNPVIIEVDDERVPVLSMESLAAIALQTGRAKDLTRLLQFLQSTRFDRGKFTQLCGEHGLQTAWDNFQQRFPEIK